MLDNENSSEKLNFPLANAPCLVRLPPQWEDFFEKTGWVPAILPDRRRFPRVYLRTQALLVYRQTFPALPRPAIAYTVYTKDISRGGIGFLHGEQLFPSEQMILILPDGKARLIQVVRCRRIGPNCFEIGAQFAGNPSPGPPG